MLSRQTINDSYYCVRSKPDGKVTILTTNSYVVGEYDDRSGDIRWQRVVLANQKIAIHNYMQRHYPIKVEVPVKVETPKASRKATAAA
jgi:hypothetical protein